MASNLNEQSSDFSTTLKYLDALVDEALQVYELDNEKTNIVDELYHSLKVITGFLGFSIDISPDLLNLSANTRIILTASLDILIIQPNGKSEQIKLKDFPFEKTLNILEYAIPSMISQIRTERTSMNEKITFLRTAAKKLQHLRTINETHEISNPLLSVEGVKS
jgi:hypothetical protein